MAPAQQWASSLGNGPFLATTLSYLSSRSKARDLRFSGTFPGNVVDRCRIHTKTGIKFDPI